jgi:multiubiquitin
MVSLRLLQQLRDKTMNQEEISADVRIHIDREPYHSPNPTTGSALYRLANINGHRELFREAEGNHEDQLIPNDRTKVHLTPDEHFYSQKEFKIIVNARAKEVAQRVLWFDDLVRLAFGDKPPTGPNIVITITYHNGPHKNPEGNLRKGESVTIRDGMIFNVDATDRS